jgi:hypothetical protein
MLLEKVSRVFKEPFPHIVIENALKREFYDKLIKTQPSPESIIRGQPYGPNERIDLPTELTKTLSPIWQEFCSYHVSMDFLQKVFDVFGGFIESLYPGVESVGMRCQPGLNTPSNTLCKVRGPHLDNPLELYAGLFYTDSDGANLEFYKWKEKKFYGKLEVPEDCVELVKTVPCRPNTYVMFLNGDKSLHGVTPRKSVNFRRMVNIVGDADRPLFVAGHNGY